MVGCGVDSVFFYHDDESSRYVKCVADISFWTRSVLLGSSWSNVIVCALIAEPRAVSVSVLFVYLFLAQQPQWARASSFTRFLDHTQRHTTVGRTSLDEWSARRRDLYLTTHNTHNRQTSMSPVGFKPTFSTGERPQTYALGRAATGTGSRFVTFINFWKKTLMDPRCVSGN